MMTTSYWSTVGTTSSLCSYRDYAGSAGTHYGRRYSWTTTSHGPSPACTMSEKSPARLVRTWFSEQRPLHSPSAYPKDASRPSLASTIHTVKESASLRNNSRVSTPRMWKTPDRPLQIPCNEPTVTHCRPSSGSGPGNASVVGGPAGWHRARTGGATVGAGTIFAGRGFGAAGGEADAGTGSAGSGASPGRTASEASSTGAVAAATTGVEWWPSW